jgi:hypothetical protein
MAEIVAKLEHVLCSNSHPCRRACSASSVPPWLLSPRTSSADCAPISQRLLRTCHCSDVELLPQNRSLLDTRLSPRRIGVTCWASAGLSTPPLPSALPSPLPSAFRHDFLSSRLYSLRAHRADPTGASDTAHGARTEAFAGRVGLEQASLRCVCTAWSVYRRHKQALAKRSHYLKRGAEPPQFSQLRL